MSDDHTLGIHGKLQHVAADLNHDKAVIYVEHEVPEPGAVTSTKISEEQVRKALGVSHINLNNVHAVSVTTNAQAANGLTGVTLRSGDGAVFPTTERHCAMVGDSAMAAAHAITMPGTVSESGEMTLKAIQTDKHAFKPHGDKSAEEKKRDELNAALYSHSGAAPDDDVLYKHTVKAQKDGVTKIAIPLKENVTNDDGALTAVASRCIIAQKKAPQVLAGDATIITMPHKSTGVDCDHLLVSEQSAKAMTAQIKENTKVQGTLGHGLIVETHALGEMHSPGDKVIHKIVLHRTPTGDKDKVTYMRDLVPEGITTPAAALDAPETVHEAAWHKAMFAKSKPSAGPAQTIQHDHELAGNQDGGAAEEPVN